jgi:hypothetical protein
MSTLKLTENGLKPVLGIFFSIGAIVMFGELLIAIKTVLSFNFSAGRIPHNCPQIPLRHSPRLGSGFNLFENTVAPLVWRLPGVNSN